MSVSPTVAISGQDAQGTSRPAPMEGGGAYDRGARVQADSSLTAVPLLEHAAGLVPLAASPAPIVIADYGSATGRNSLAPIKAAIGVFRRRTDADRAISVIHTDLPENDFATLFRTVSEQPGGYLAGDDAVFPMAVGRSFYGQILPDESVTLGWSSWAVQWLSQVPAAIPDHIHIAFTRDAAARTAFARQAASDWQEFLLSRGRELVAGGRMVVMTMACSDDGDFGYRAVTESIHHALAELTGTGFLRPDEMRRMVIPTVGRSRADLLAPFSALGHCAGLRVEQIQLFMGDDRNWSQFERDGDAGLFGRKWAAFSRTSVFPTLALGLDGGPADPRIHEFYERLELAMAGQLARQPQPTSMPLAILVLAKEPS